MNLHKNKELFSQAVEMTSQHFRIKREFVEKDYWICRSLHLLAAADKDCHAVFLRRNKFDKSLWHRLQILGRY